MTFVFYPLPLSCRHQTNQQGSRNSDYSPSRSSTNIAL
jgi:hypothetical protein